MSFRFFLLAWVTFLHRCSAQGGFSGVWHLVDALSVVCPAGKGSATVTIEKPTTSEYEPHIFTIFRTAKSSVSLSFIARDATGKVVTDQSNGIALHAGTYRRLSGLTGSEDTNASARELWGMRRRMSSGSRRRTGSGGGGGINLNPTTWFSPRRRISTPTYPAASTGIGSPRRRIAAVPAAAAGAGAAGAAGAYGSPRRRGTMAPAPGGAGYGFSDRRRSSVSAASGYGYSSVRRRRTYIAGGSSSGYSNPYSSSYMGSYGYPSAGYAMSAFGGHTPLSTSYGYSGMNAYQGSSGYTIAMAGGAGLLAGYVAWD
eukprot:s2427_g2.t1